MKINTDNEAYNKKDSGVFKIKPAIGVSQSA